MSSRLYAQASPAKKRSSIKRIQLCAALPIGALQENKLILLNVPLPAQLCKLRFLVTKHFLVIPRKRHRDLPTVSERTFIICIDLDFFPNLMSLPPNNAPFVHARNVQKQRAA